MPITLQELERQEVLQELARLFSEPRSAYALLERIGFSRAQVPDFSTALTPSEFWRYVAREIEAGLTPGGLEQLLAAAAEVYPFNARLVPWRREEAKLSTRTESGSSLVIRGEVDIRLIMSRARAFCSERGLGAVEIGVVTEQISQLRLPDATPEQALELAADLQSDGLVPSRPTVVPNQFRDYLLQSLYIEGPADHRFELNDVPVSTRVRDVARATISHYADDIWPHDRRENARPAAVDLVRSDGTTRLDPHATLHDSGVGEGDTLHVAPQATAGGGLFHSLLVETVTGDRFELSDVPVLARVRDIARATAAQYGDEKRAGVVESLDSSGASRRLELEATLLEAGIRDGNRLYWAPESTVGGGDGGSLGGGGFSGLPPRPERRNLSAWFPERIRAGTHVPLLVRITLGPQGDSSSELRSLPIPVRGIEVRLQVQVAGFELVSPASKTLRVTPDRDSEWAVFELRAARTGVHTIRVSAFHGPSYLGTLALQATIDERGETGPHADRCNPLSPRRREPGEVTLLIHFDENQRVYRYQLIDDTVGGFEEVLSHPLQRTPFAAIEDLVLKLRQLASGQFGYSPRATRAWLKGEGTSLWRELIPEALQSQFRERRDHIRRMFVLSSGDPIPWELLYPYGNDNEDRGFLAEQFPVARWEYGQAPPSTLHAGRANLVLPAGSPEAAAVEIEAVRQLLLRRRIAVGEPLGELDDLLNLFDSADFHLLHFACHNTFELDSPNASNIRMGRAPFQPTFLSEHQDHFRGTGPLVFLNACRTASTAPLYTQLAGWAHSFLRAGCGAFVGTQWEVRDDSARTFAEVFYRSLTGGSNNLGDALMAARRAIQDEPGDPTWLAYTLYGDPAAILSGLESS